MKKVLALVLAVALMLGMTSGALAWEEYDSTLLSALDYSSTEMTKTGVRPATCALILLDYMLATGETDVLSSLAASGTARLAAYGACLDVYFECTNGRYRNLFYAPGSEKITDYGEKSITSISDKYTYYRVDMADVLSAMIDLLGALKGDD